MARMRGAGLLEAFNPSPCPSPSGRGDGVATVVQASPLPEGEGQGEGRFAQFVTPAGVKFAPVLDTSAFAGVRA
jgi:hypothetical protein